MSLRGVLAIGTLAALADAGGSAAANRPVATLAGGQIRWFLPGALHTGDLIRCVVNGHSIDAKIAAPPGAGASGSDFAWKRGGVSIQIARHSNGATEIACGTAFVEPSRRPTLPYVSGQNGLGLIRGANRLERVEQLFGASSSQHGGARTCRVVWHAIGLQATFDGTTCASGSTLQTATVTGRSWSSLTGVRIGDTVAELRWLRPGAKLVTSAHHRGVWLLSRASASQSKLYAVTGPAGTVTAFTNVVR